MSAAVALIQSLGFYEDLEIASVAKDSMLQLLQNLILATKHNQMVSISYG